MFHSEYFFPEKVLILTIDNFTLEVERLDLSAMLGDTPWAIEPRHLAILDFILFPNIPG